MKLTVALMVLALFVPALVFADGFRCAGDGYRVKLYDQTQPMSGTRSPAVLVVSSDEDGVVTVVGSEQIARTREGSTVTYSGEGKQGPLDVHVSFVVTDDTRPEGDDHAPFDGNLAVAMSDGYSIHADMECVGYLKGQ